MSRGSSANNNANGTNSARNGLPKLSLPDIMHLIDDLTGDERAEAIRAFEIIYRSKPKAKRQYSKREYGKNKDYAHKGDRKCRHRMHMQRIPLSLETIDMLTED